MSGRRFRILSDSEDESNAITESTAQKETTGASSDENAAAPRRKRARILSDDSSDDIASDSGVRDGDGNLSVEPNARSPLRIVPRQGSPANDRNQSDGNESDARESVGSERILGGHESDGNDAQDPQSDNANEEDGERPAPRDDEAEEAQETSGRRVVKKRVVKNPQPKLDSARLTGERGLGRLRNMYPTIHLKGKGHEREDLKCILHNLQLWGHRMFPKMQTKEIFERCVRLGAKMPVRVHLRRMRTGEIHDFLKPIIESEDDLARGIEEPRDTLPENPDNVEEEEPPPLNEGRDMFQELLEQRYPPTQMPDSTPLPESTQDAPGAQNDLEAKIQAKKLEALRRREELRARREAQKREEELIEARMALEIEAADATRV